MFGFIHKIVNEARVGKRVADVVEILAVGFDYSLQQRDKEVLFDLCREFADDLNPFETAMFFIVQFASQRYPKDGQNAPLHPAKIWVAAVKNAKQAGAIPADSADQFIESITDYFGLPPM